MKKIIILLMVLLVLPLCLAEQVLWDDDSDIKIFDTWYDVDGLPLTGADCSWQVYNSTGINQSGVPQEFSEGVFNFTILKLDIGIYPLLINCSKNGFNCTSSKNSIKIVDELSEEYKKRLEDINLTVQEINETTHETNILVEEINITTYSINLTVTEIYNYLFDDLNVSITTILNTTNVIYSEVVEIDDEIDLLTSDFSSLRDYLEDKWGNENADKIMEKLKDINKDTGYLRSEFYYLSAQARNEVWLSIKSDTRELRDMIYEDEIKWGKLLKWVIPIVFVILLFIIIIYLIKRKPKEKSFGGVINE